MPTACSSGTASLQRDLLCRYMPLRRVLTLGAVSGMAVTFFSSFLFYEPPLGAPSDPRAARAPVGMPAMSEDTSH